jgi:DNA-nicking Smr family endonuclease
MAKNRRALTVEESALWDAVARTAMPLRPKPMFPSPKPAEAKKADKPPNALALTTSPPKKPSLHQAPLDRHTTRRIAKGRIKLDARLDLHGHTQTDAHHRLLQFLSDIQDRGGRLVLVITGKGSFGEGGGILRRMLPGWLASPRFKPLVSGFEEAHRSHGGTGAFYVRLRRPGG